MPGKVSGAKTKQLKERFISTQVNWQQVSKVIGNKKTVLDRKSFTNLEFTVCKGHDQNYIGGAALKMSVVLS